MFMMIMSSGDSFSFLFTVLPLVSIRLITKPSLSLILSHA